MVRGRKLLALQDPTGTVLLQLPTVSNAFRVGDEVRVEATNCWITQTPHAYRITPCPLVDNDGIHAAITKSGRIFLNAGFQPVRLEWFQYNGREALSLEYDGPGISRRKVPEEVLWHKPPGARGFQPGLDFSAYNTFPAGQLPEFEEESPVTNGVAERPDLSYAARADYTALVFSGFLRIPVTGEYTFYCTSDDGSRLYVGKPSTIACTLIGTNSARRTIPLAQALSKPNGSQWVEAEGEAIFAGGDGESLEIEMAEKNGSVPVTVLDAGALVSNNLLHRRIRVTGIREYPEEAAGGEFSGMIVPSMDEVEILPSTDTGFRNYSTNDLLTTAAQVRRLSHAQAALEIPVKITGVAIDQNVLEDASGGGVYIHYDALNLADPPQVGQMWEVEGRTGPGDFSPVIYADKAKCLGAAALPEPILPTWDQLMDGSLDAEYVELRGAVTAISPTEMALLTPDGTVTVEEGAGGRPWPTMTMGTGGSLIDSVVRIRGCFTADWNWDTRQVFPGRFHLYPPNIEVEEPAPQDPFSLPTTDAADLLEFNARADPLQLTKVAGQIIGTRPDEYFLRDGQAGIRVLTAQPSQNLGLRVGDLVEAVGFPKLGGPSPVFQDAQIRETGHAPLPAPVLVAETNVLDRSLDATLVQVAGLLLSDTVHGDERVLELQSGAQRFAAVLKWDPRIRAQLASGSRLQLRGVYASEEQPPVGGSFYPFEILLNNAAGIVVLQQPSWWTVRRAVTVAAGLGVTLGLSFIWITLLHRKVEQRTAQLQEEIEERQSEERNRVLEQERTRVARDLHDELGAGLTELSILGELGNNPAIPAEEKENYLQQLTALTRALVSGLDEIVWAINPHYDSIASVATYFSFFADRFLKLAGIACRLRLPESMPEFPLDSRVRHGIFLAFKEALNNVVRHSHASEVELRMEVADNELAIAIRDNGRGLPLPESAPGSDGLAGMRQRLEQLGGDCRITSQPGRGTTVEFCLPLLPGAVAPNTHNHDQNSHRRRQSDHPVGIGTDH